jgi:hypothetical protein
MNSSDNTPQEGVKGTKRSTTELSDWHAAYLEACKERDLWHESYTTLAAENSLLRARLMGKVTPDPLPSEVSLKAYSEPRNVSPKASGGGISGGGTIA